MDDGRHSNLITSFVAIIASAIEGIYPTQIHDVHDESSNLQSASCETPRLVESFALIVSRIRYLHIACEWHCVYNRITTRSGSYAAIAILLGYRRRSRCRFGLSRGRIRVERI